jgi:cytochrome bd-type quinol oxidase subunit 2
MMRAPRFRAWRRAAYGSSQPANRLTVAGSSSSQDALAILLVLTLMTVPLILLYQACVHRLFRHKVRGREAEY